MERQGFGNNELATGKKSDQYPDEPDFDMYDARGLRKIRKDYLFPQRGRIIRKLMKAERANDQKEVERIRKDLEPLDYYIKKTGEYLDLL